MLFQDYYLSKFGLITFTASASGLLSLTFSSDDHTRTINANNITNLTKSWLNDYFVNQQTLIEIPLSSTFSNFQQLVYKTLQQEVTFGNYISYKRLALLVNSSPRAIGKAMAINPVCLYIPCHRVINQNGKLGGFLFGLELKQQLLNHEQGL